MYGRRPCRSSARSNAGRPPGQSASALAMRFAVAVVESDGGIALLWPFRRADFECGLVPNNLRSGRIRGTAGPGRWEGQACPAQAEQACPRPAGIAARGHEVQHGRAEACGAPQAIPRDAGQWHRQTVRANMFTLQRCSSALRTTWTDRPEGAGLPHGRRQQNAPKFPVARPLKRIDQVPYQSMGSPAFRPSARHRHAGCGLTLKTTGG